MRSGSAALFFFVFPRALNLFFGLVYPAWFSLIAIESKDTVDDTQWLVYWLVFSLIQILETFLWPILEWVPPYLMLKTALLGWLVLPYFRGASFLYETVLAPASGRLKAEIAKVPALEFLVTPGGQADVAAAARTPEEEQASAAQRKAQLGGTVNEVTQAFQADSERISGIADAKARARAERTWAKDLSRLNKLATARQSGASPSGLFLGHRMHAS
ncbi:hypothetical protein WJX81_002122 [Elliptochloris bilobata]|uniref:HVA22-like protein n=1 Tax=Elliptochloris bilobata TaxID=381761 RepID=A0AAW1QMM9_9CHLO